MPGASDDLDLPRAGDLELAFTLPNALFLVVAETTMAIASLLIVLVSTNLNSMPAGLAQFLALRVSVKNVMLLTGFMVGWPTLFWCCGLYDAKHLRGFRREAVGVLSACSMGTVLALLFPLTSVSGALQIAQLRHFWMLTVSSEFLIRGVRCALAHKRRARRPQRVIIAGSGRRAARLHRTLREDPHTGYEILGFVDTDSACPRQLPNVRPLGTLDHLEEVLMRQAVDDVFITLPVKSQYLEIQRAIRICELAGVRVKYPADVFTSSLAKSRFEAGEGSPVVAMHMVAHDFRVPVKRVIDVAGALAALVVLSPVMLITAVAIKLTSRGPIVFRQQRYGLNKRRFDMYKFRTMVPNAEQLQAQLEDRNEASGPVFKIKHDPRITPLGRFLRRSSIDELPQLWNVVLGHMSLVGPRPLPIRDVTLFTRPSDMRRFSVRPGITGLWQVSGRSNLSFERWVELDLRYIDRWSLTLDFLILLRTVRAVLTKTGAA
jgi:exopolysaccharide biosynthesis polyprenyl glycosylphosphotransferase